MKLLLDQGLPRTAAPLLQKQGHDAVHAADESRIVVTLDADFSMLLAISQAAGPSVIRVRQEGVKAEILVKLLSLALDEYGSELLSGATVTVRDGKARARRLPIRSAD